MWTESNNYRKIDRACSKLCDMNKISFTSGRNDTPSSRIWTLIRVVITALICPRVDFFQASDGAVSFEDFPKLSIVFSCERRYANKSWDRVRVLEQYVDRNCCEIRTDGAHTYVALETAETGSWFKLMSGIALLCPWIFADKPLNDVEKEFLKMISEYGNYIDQNRFDEICGILYDRLDFDKYVLDQVAYSLTKKSYDKRLKSAKDDIESCRQQIQYYEAQINEYLNVLQDRTAKLNGLYNVGDKGSDELLEFLKSAEIHDFEVGSDKVYFTVYSLLSCYEEGQVKPYVFNNHRVLSGERGNTPYTEQEMKAFYKAVFEDKTLGIKLAARYSISMDINVEAISQNQTLNSDRINNPNIGYAGCLGGYRGDLRQAQEAHDPVAALSICQQSACSVNLGEIWPMIHVTRDLFRSTGKVIHTDDGDITFDEAMERIKAQMNKE